MKTQAVKVGNIGVVTPCDGLLCRVTKVENGFVFSEPLDFAGCFRCCYEADFWVLLDSFTP